MARMQLVSKQEMPAADLRTHGAMGEAIKHLTEARRLGRAIRLDFDPDERSGKYAYRYRKAAARLGVQIRIASEQRPYRSGRGTLLSEPARLFVEVLEPSPATARSVDQEPAAAALAAPSPFDWDAGRPTMAEPENDPAPRLMKIREG